MASRRRQDGGRPVRDYLVHFFLNPGARRDPLYASVRP